MRTQTQVLHSPTLNTIMMVEKTLKDARQVVKISELKRMLPKKVMHGTLLEILDYLQVGGKIFMSTKGVVWVYATPAELEKLKKGGLIV